VIVSPPLAWQAFHRALSTFVPRRSERLHLERLAREYGDAREADARAAVAIERRVGHFNTGGRTA
jgi:uncharacterized protein YdaU (DUF1376 family)